MIKNNIIIILLLLILSSYTGDDNSSDYQYIKKKYKVKKITYNKELNVFFIEKRGNCGLVSSKEMDYKLLIPLEYDSILPQKGNFSPILVWKDYKIGLYSSEYKKLLNTEYYNVKVNNYNEGLIEVSQNNKRGIYDLRYEKFFVETLYEKVEFLDYNYSAGLVLLSNDEKCGLFNVYKNIFIFDISFDKIMYHNEFVKDVNGNFYESYVEVVVNGISKYYDGTNLNDKIKLYGYSTLNMSRLRYLNADTLVESKLSVKGEFIARSEVSQKWGLYENYDDLFRVIIPAKYDGIDFYGWGCPLTIIEKDGYKGYFIKKWEDNLDSYPQTCIYDDLRIVEDDKYRKLLAAKINKRWYWIDWYQGTYNKDVYYNTFEEMVPSEENLSIFYKLSTSFK